MRFWQNPKRPFRKNGSSNEPSLLGGSVTDSSPGPVSSLSLFATSTKFLFHVSSLMCNKIGAVAEAFATLGALVGLLPCVDSLVYNEN